MKKAIELARYAASIDEVPVGAVVVRGEELISCGYNQREGSLCVTKHAEIIAIEEACRKLGSWKLVDCELYVTLEPCLMCAGAIYQARLTRVCFGSYDPKGGALGSLYNIHEDRRLNHRFEVLDGVCAEESSLLLKDFFAKKRL
jgi:tRNA(adenine34) deaminase